MPVPRENVGKKFADLGAGIYSHRDLDNPIVLIGVKSGQKVMLNPKPSDFNTFKKDDEVIVIAFDRPHKLI